MTEHPQLWGLIENTRKKLVSAAILCFATRVLCGLFLGAALGVVYGWVVSPSLVVMLVFGLLGASISGWWGYKNYSAGKSARTTKGAVEALAIGDERLLRHLLIGADLSRWGEDDIESRRASAELVRAELEYAQNLPVPEQKLFEGLKRESAYLLACVAVFALAVFTAPQNLRDNLNNVSVPFSAPKVSNQKITIIPPAYTELSAYFTENADGSVSAYPGSKVTVEGSLSVAFARGVFVGPGGVELSLANSGANFEVTFTALEEGDYRLKFFDQTGREVLSTSPKPIALKEDTPPKVELVSPSADVEVKESEDVEIRYGASDDFGLKKLELVIKGDEEVRIPLGGMDKNRAGGAYTFSPAGYPKLGRGAYLRVEATDNDDVKGPKVGQSASIYLTIMNKERLAEEIGGFEERLVEAMLLHLADHLDYPSPSGDRLQKMRDSARDLAKLLKSLADRLSVADDASSIFGQAAILNINGTLGPKLDEWREGKAQSTGPLVFELERSIIFLDDLMKKLRMDEVLAMGDELSALEDDLLQKIKRGEGTEALNKAVNRIEELLDAMANKLAKESSLPDGFVNSEAVKNDKTSSISDKLEQLKEAIKNGDKEKAQRLAEEIISELSEWMENLEKAADEEMAGEESPLTSELKNVKKMVDEAIAEEDKIMGETRKIADETSEKAAKRIADLMRAQKASQKNKIDKIMSDLSQMDMITQKNYSPENPNSLRELNEQRARSHQLLNQLNIDLDSDIGKALSDANLLENALKNLTRESLVTEENEEDKDKLLSLGEDAIKNAAEISKDLKNLLGKRKESLGEQGKAKLEGLKSDQEKLGEKLSDIGKVVDEIAQKSPGVKGLSDPLGKAQGSSKGAQNSLWEGDPYGAMPSERGVIESLADFSGKLQKQMEGSKGQGKGMKKRRGGGQGQGREVDRSKVEIPGVSDETRLKAFREDVLKAMREGKYIKDFEKETERYYEGLIK